MVYKKTLLCLANSRKHSGRCVAGLELREGRIGEWVRPVSDRPSEELSIEDRRYEDGSDVRVLDIVTIAFKEHRPHGCQQENHVIDDGYYWAREGRFEAAELLGHARKSGPLWVDGASSYSGQNDRISVEAANRLSSSLLLVAPKRAAIQVVRGLKKLQVRLDFQLTNARYNFVVTDPRVEADYLGRGEGEFQLPAETVLCVSLGEPFEGYRYKLAAGIVTI